MHWGLVVAVLIAVLVSGCAYTVPSMGYVHVSNPNAGTGSPHPERNELSSDFLGGGFTVEIEDADISVWLGVKRHNMTFSDLDRVGPGGVVILSQKFR